MATEKQRQRIVDSLMALAAEKAWHDISLADVATRAELPLATIRSAYAGRRGILADFVARIDARLLDEAERDRATDEGIGDGDAEQPARDRLLDVIMRRLDLLAPHKQAVRRLSRSARCDPALAACLARIGLSAQPWTLAAAGIEASSPLGKLRAGGLALVMARVVPIWLDDDEPGLGRTMAALDRTLARGEAMLDRVEKVGCKVMRFAERMCERGRAARRDRKAAEDAGPDAAAADAGAV
jgi:AcrR family transcriptional regulator